MAAASWMHSEAEQSEDSDATLILARDLLSRCRVLVDRLKTEGRGPRSASSDKCLVFCLLLVGFSDACSLLWLLSCPRSLAQNAAISHFSFLHIQSCY